jgi:toxin HigB-1
MIRSFADKETEKIFNREFSRRLPQELHRSILRKLLILDAAEVLNDLRIPPSNHLEKLRHASGEHYSVRINDQWRLCFVWRENNAYEVQVIDYHKG